jgi:hypothetical protein
MGKKMAKAGLFSLAALGAGAAVFMAGKKEKGCAKKCTAPKEKKQTDYSDYRNTERDKQKKNSKGIYFVLCICFLCRFLFSLLIQISYFPLHFGQISSIIGIGFSASKR